MDHETREQKSESQHAVGWVPTSDLERVYRFLCYFVVSVCVSKSL